MALNQEKNTIFFAAVLVAPGTTSILCNFCFTVYKYYYIYFFLLYVCGDFVNWIYIAKIDTCWFTRFFTPWPVARKLIISGAYTRHPLVFQKVRIFYIVILYFHLCGSVGNPCRHSTDGKSKVSRVKIKRLFTQVFFIA